MVTSAPDLRSTSSAGSTNRFFRAFLWTGVTLVLVLGVSTSFTPSLARWAVLAAIVSGLAAVFVIYKGFTQYSTWWSKLFITTAGAILLYEDFLLIKALRHAKNLRFVPGNTFWVILVGIIGGAIFVSARFLFKFRDEDVLARLAAVSFGGVASAVFSFAIPLALGAIQEIVFVSFVIGAIGSFVSNETMRSMIRQRKTEHWKEIDDE